MHHRRSIRLADYDYTTNGAYFITLCTHNKDRLFGEIVDGRMMLNAWGEIVQDCITVIPKHFPQTEVDIFVIMPNHLHMIIAIDRQDERRGLACQTPTNKPTRQFGKPIAQSLPTIVGAFKSAVTKHINRTREHRTPIWQRNYYEHIIRDHDRYDIICAYIESNPQRWAEDMLYIKE